MHSRVLIELLDEWVDQKLKFSYTIISKRSKEHLFAYGVIIDVVASAAVAEGITGVAVPIGGCLI